MIRKIIFFLLFIVVISFHLFAQVRPESYDIIEKSLLQKISTDNPASNYITDILTLNDTIWLGTSRGISFSSDRGMSWTNFYQTLAFGTESVSAIGFDKYSGTFWAATAHSIKVDNNSLPVGSGLRFTIDNGITWRTIPQPVDDPGDSLIVYGINDGINLPKVRALPVTVAVQNIIYDIAFTPNTVWITTYAGGLRKSTDMGNTWQRVLLPSDSLGTISPNDTIRFSLQPVAGKFGKESYLNHRGFSVISINDSTLYVGTAGGINKSTDKGISWRKFNHLNQSFPISGNFVVGLGMNTYDQTLWAATGKAEGQTEFYGVSSTTDDGETWQTFLEDEKVHNFGFKYNNVIAPSDNGAFRTNNKGLTWILPNSIYDEQSKLAVTTNFFNSAASQGNDVWLGSADGLAKITEVPGTMWEGKWKVYFASIPLISKDEAYVFPNPYSPRIDEGLKFKYTTDGITTNVTIRIYDFAMNYVRTIIQNAPRNISSDIERVMWDGKDDSANIVPNGVYFYRIDIGDRDPLYGKIIVMQ